MLTIVLLAGSIFSGECDPRIAESPLAQLESVFQSQHEVAAAQARLAGVDFGTLSGRELKAALADAMQSTHRGTVSYSSARKIVFQQYADDQGRVWDVYGERWARGRWLPDPNDVNIEHVWPQSRFKSGWSSLGKSRKGAAMKADLHNLLPTDNKLNGQRGHEEFGEVGDCPPRKSCQKGRGTFEPPDAVKGNVARALFYMSVRYGMGIPDHMERDLRAWHEMDPPDPGEQARNDENALVQGNRNYFVDDPTLVGRLGDF